MPRGDRTGPAGMGPRTGRGAGYCAGHDMPGYAHPFPRGGFGQGFGRGWGRSGAPGMGRRWRRWQGRYMHPAMGRPDWQGYGPGWYAPAEGYGPYEPAPEQELDGLKNQAEWLKEEMEAISKRIEELEVQGEGA